MNQTNVLWYIHGAIVGILLSFAFHILVVSKMEVPVKQSQIAGCLKAGGEITKVKVGGNVVCKVRRR